MLNLSYKEYRILDKEEIAPESFLFRLEGHLDFKPGQFIEAALDHFGTITLAPCSHHKNIDFFELCIRANGNRSAAISNLLVGDSLKIRGPYGNGWPIDQIKNRELILVGGGMGMVPIRSLLHDLTIKRSKNKKIHLIAGAKTSHHFVFYDEIEKLQDLIDVEAYAERSDRHFFGKKGLITEPIRTLEFNAKKALVFICGPEIMYQYVISELNKRGVLDDQIYVSMERRMECGIGVCQHCNCGKHLVCKDGPVFRWDHIQPELNK
ncbi:MAG: FAD/NAD(P)-binding protein [Patescibacteria group bacterium]